MKLNMDLTASAIGTLIILVAVILSFQYSPTARLVPLVIGLPTLALMVMQLVLDSLPAARGLKDLGKRDVFGADRYLKERKAGHRGAAGGSGPGPAQPDGQVRLFQALAFVLGLAVGIYLLGFLVAIPLVLLVFLRWVSRESWVSAFLTTLVTSAALYVTFVVFLKVRLFEGLVFLMWR